MAAEKEVSFINGGSIMDGIGLDSLERRQRVPVNISLRFLNVRLGVRVGFYYFFPLCFGERERDAELE